MYKLFSKSALHQAASSNINLIRSAFDLYLQNPKYAIPIILISMSTIAEAMQLCSCGMPASWPETCSDVCGQFNIDDDERFMELLF